jgi:hypothetical protein
MKNVHKFCGSLAFKAEKNTMSTLSDTMMLTLFIPTTPFILDIIVRAL